MTPFRANPRSLPVLWEVIYYVCLAMLFAEGIWLRVQLPPIPVLDGDSWEYLQPALAGGWPTYREFLYPLLLQGILWVHSSFIAITVVQHAAGVLAAMVLLLAWHRMRIFLPADIVVERLHRIGGLVMTIIYLLSGDSVYVEHVVRPEAFFTLTIALCLWVAVEFSRKAFGERRFGMREGGLSILLIVLSSTAYYLRPYWGAGMWCSIIPLLVAAVVVRGNGVVKWGSFACGLILVYILFTVPNQWLHPQEKYTGSGYYLSESLFCSSCEIIHDLLQEDVRTLPSEDPMKPRLERLIHEANESCATDPHRSYGYTRWEPDEIRYAGPLSTLKQSLNDDEKRVKDFYYSYYFRAWREYPFRMIHKIAIQLWFFYSPMRAAVFSHKDKIEVLPAMLRSQRTVMETPSAAWPTYQDYAHQVFALQSTKQVVRIPPLVVTLGNVMNALYTPSLLFTLLATIALQLGYLRGGDLLKSSSLWALYLFSYNFGMSFTIAFVHLMDRGRYHVGQTLFSILSECFAIVFLISVIRVLLRQPDMAKFLNRLVGRKLPGTFPQSW